MKRPILVPFGRKDSKRNLQLFLALSLLASSLIWQGCSAVPQSAAAPAQKPAPQDAKMVLPGSTVGSSYHQVLATLSPFESLRLTQGELPPGLALNPTSGTISGVPTQEGTFTFTIIVTGVTRADATSKVYSLNVGRSKKAISVQISPTATPFTLGGQVQFSALVKNTSNTAVNWSASAGTISATGLWTAPASTSLQTISITATSAADPSVQASATATIATSTLTIITPTLPSGVLANSYSVSLAASGGHAPYQWGIASGSLPAGLKLDSATGTLSGSPTSAGTYSLNIQATDATSQSTVRGYSILVSEAATCGPPTYGCSRTDSNVVQVPTPPNVGILSGANTIVADPDFGNRIVRITDANTNPLANFQNRTFITATSGSADENLWNLDSTLFVVQDTGARAYPFSFDPSTLQAARMYVSNSPTTNGLTLMNSGVWSRVSPNILFTASGTSISKYDFTDRTNAPSPQLVYDFTSSPNCLPAGFTTTWQSRGGVSGDDTVMAMSYSNQGGQGTGVYAVAYKVGSGCTMLNTQTGQVSGDWGAQGTINLPDRWTIHNVKLSKDGNWLIIARQGCTSSSCLSQPYFWQIGTTNVVACGQGGYCSGHWTEGYTHWINNNNSPLTSQMSRLFSVPNSLLTLTTYFPAGVTGNLDQHQSWNNVDPNDSVPVLSTTRSPTTPFPAPWYNEIIGLAPDGSGTVWRFSHSFISTKSQWFPTAEGIGSVSQDGRFFIFSSDWMGTLGSETGSPSCTIGTNCRGDVFVVELK